MKKFMLFSAFVCCLTAYAAGAYAAEPAPVAALFNDLTAKTISFEFDDPVTVTGFVIDTGISKYATPFVALSDTKGGRQYATCVLPRTDALKLRDFKKGEEVVIEGNFYSLRDDRVVIKKCRKVVKGS
ncbi:MAG: hypothetical protein LBR69_06005 [Endomicrobium sp.]|jgi:hypothetical protein|nr:hypothetical protein [Endomicrobium sp.]